MNDGLLVIDFDCAIALPGRGPVFTEIDDTLGRRLPFTGVRLGTHFDGTRPDAIPGDGDTPVSIRARDFREDLSSSEAALTV